MGSASSADAIRNIFDLTSLLQRHHMQVVAAENGRDAIKGLDSVMKEAVNLKFISEPLTQKQLDELIQIPPRNSSRSRHERSDRRRACSHRWARVPAHEAASQIAKLSCVDGWNSSSGATSREDRPCVWWWRRKLSSTLRFAARP